MKIVVDNPAFYDALNKPLDYFTKEELADILSEWGIGHLDIDIKERLKVSNHNFQITSNSISLNPPFHCAELTVVRLKDKYGAWATLKKFASFYAGSISPVLREKYERNWIHTAPKKLTGYIISSVDIPGVQQIQTPEICVDTRTNDIYFSFGQDGIYPKKVLSLESFRMEISALEEIVNLVVNKTSQAFYQRSRKDYDLIPDSAIFSLVPNSCI